MQSAECGVCLCVYSALFIHESVFNINIQHVHTRNKVEKEAFFYECSSLGFIKRSNAFIELQTMAALVERNLPW